MSALALLNAGLQALALAFGFQALGFMFCRGLGIMPDAKGGRAKPRPAGVGVALCVGFLVPLLWHVGADSTTQGDAFYPPEAQARLAGALAAGGLALLAWGWRLDFRRRYPLATLWLLWGAQAAVWVAGLRIDSVSPGIPLVWKGSLIHLPPWASFFATLLWLSAVSAVIELLDGVDGLAGLASGLGSLAIFLHAWLASPGDLFVQLVAWLLAVCSLWAARAGRPGQKTMLGKNGALPLGFWFAALTVLARQKGAAAGALTPLLAAWLVLGVWTLAFAERSMAFANSGPPKA